MQKIKAWEVAKIVGEITRFKFLISEFKLEKDDKISKVNFQTNFGFNILGVGDEIDELVSFFKKHLTEKIEKLEKDLEAL